MPFARAAGAAPIAPCFGIKAKSSHVVGARPNLMKLAPVHRALAEIPKIEQLVVRTGQHYGLNVFFQQLGIATPEINPQVGSGSHAKQTAENMMRFEDVATEHRPNLVLVYGDVNSPVVAALVCSKLGIRVAHVRMLPATQAHTPDAVLARFALVTLFAPRFREFLLQELIERLQIVDPPALASAHFTEIAAEFDETCVALAFRVLFPGQDLIDLRENADGPAAIEFRRHRRKAVTPQAGQANPPVHVLASRFPTRKTCNMVEW
jgi:UDP-N-acetylglucosamine 2-epimerase